MKSSDLSFYIETLGCPKNIVDSRTMRSTLLQNGFSQASSPDTADVILVNTCSFVKEAQESTIDTIFDALKLKKKPKNKNRKVGIIGCFAQQFSGELETEIPEVDFIMGTGRYHEIANVLSQKFAIELNPLKPGEIINQKNILETPHPYAYFRIAQGCSRKCAFCIIPTIRGNLINYSLDDMKRQYDQELSARSHLFPLREAIFVSQDTVSTPIGALKEFVEFFNKLDEIKWIRLHYLFPDKRVFDVIELMQEYSKIVPYLDIPFQHASPAILKAMNRPDDTVLFRKIINKALKSNPDLEIRTAFIIGYPGETDRDIEEIAQFLKNEPVHKCSFFRYSHEVGTPAYKNGGETVDDQAKIERINYLRDIHLKARIELRSQWIGRKTQLMLDEVNTKEIIARRPQDSPDIDEVVYLPANKKNLTLKPGDIVEAKLETAMEYDWIGELVE